MMGRMLVGWKSCYLTSLVEQLSLLLLSSLSGQKH